MKKDPIGAQSRPNVRPGGFSPTQRRDGRFTVNQLEEVRAAARRVEWKHIRAVR